MTNHTKTYVYPNEPTRFDLYHLNELLAYASREGASDITIQTNECILLEIYGRLHKVTKRKLTNAEVGEMLNGIYGANGTAQILSGKDVDTHYEYHPSRSERYRFRVNGTGCQVEGHEAIQITLRTIPVEPPHLKDLHVESGIIDNIMPHQGVVYVTGATGSGKSTLLASIIRELAEQQDSNRKILTYESPIEFVYDMIKMPAAVVSQTEIPRHLANFAAGVRNALRRKPMAILVGEARDTETIDAVIEAALTGHPVYTTLHSNGVAETMRRLVTSFPSEERDGRTIDIIETIRMVIWQKLVPTVDGKRVALREYLAFDDDVRDILLEGDPKMVTANTRKLLKERGQTMLQEATKRFKEGIIEERIYKMLSASAKSADRDANKGV